MKFGTTKTSSISFSKKNCASRRLGSSFQKAHCTSAKIPRRRISRAWRQVGMLESGFSVDPCPMMRRALSGLEVIEVGNLGRRKPNVQPNRRQTWREFNAATNSQARSLIDQPRGDHRRIPDYF